MSNAVLEVLKGARELCDQGWTQGRMSKPNGQKTEYCLIGAIVRASYGHGKDMDERVEISRKAEEKFALAIGTDWVMSWNDRAFRRREEVVAAFDRAIELEEQANEQK